MTFFFKQDQIKAVIAIVILFVSCGRNEEPIITEETVPTSQEFIFPVSTNEREQYFKIEGLEFNLPHLFRIKKSIGPDFTVYYIKYPGGSFGGIYFGQYPSLPDRIDKLTSNNPIYNDRKMHPKDPYNLRGPSDSLELNNFYHEKYENEREKPIVNNPWFQKLYQERDFMSITLEEREKYMVKDSFNLEAIKIDSNYIWKSYPLEGHSGNYDVLFSDNIAYGWRTHIFTRVNKYATVEKIHEFVAQLVRSKID